MSGKAIKKWSPRNEHIALLWLTGKSQAEIAKMFNISQSTVSRVLKDPQTEELRVRIREELRSRVIDTVAAELDDAAQLAVRAIRRTLEAEISPVHRAKPNQDRVALKVLQGRGHLSILPEGDAGGMQMSDEQFGRLLSAMSKADKASKIDPIPDADYEIVEEGE